MRVNLYLSLLLTLASVSAPASDDFDQRVATAKALEDTPQGQAYDLVLYGAIGEQIQKTMVRCFPPDRKADTKRFTLVADILSNGSATRVDVRPQTKMSACFLEGFTAAPFPKLPDYAKDGVLPIFIDMKIVH